jgi:hypothetical protein
MEKAQAKDSDLREINLNDVQKSFDNKKSVVAIGISSVMLEKLLTDVAGVFWGESPLQCNQLGVILFLLLNSKTGDWGDVKWTYDGQVASLPYTL